MINLVRLSHQILKSHPHPEIAVDMTAGNGFDTVFLATLARQVYAFDIQEEAIRHTADRLKKEQLDNVLLIKESHDLFDIYVRVPIDLAIYNLGYLPSGDHQIRTQGAVVLRSLKKAQAQLAPGGIIVIVVYPDDPEEGVMIDQWIHTLDPEFDCMKHTVCNRNSPYIVEVRRIKK